MPTRRSPRKGSLQFWPRKRGAKFLPSSNWNAISYDSAEKLLKGFICYKAGMISVEVKDSTPNSMTKDKKIIIPATILECPPMRVFSVRLYKYGKVAKDILAENFDKELKRKIRVPKTKKSPSFDKISSEDYDDLRLVFYSQPKKAKIKKKPDVIEIGLSGSFDDKLKFAQENVDKEFSVSEFFDKDDLVDFRGLTKGKGFQGPVKRFGIKLRVHKAEKGQRKVGSIGPWHPARVTFRVPMAGQMGLHTRVTYNNKIINLGKADSEIASSLKGLKNYGDLNTEYILVHGSVTGPAKRQLVVTKALRPTKMQKKKQYEVLGVRR